MYPCRLVLCLLVASASLDATIAPPVLTAKEREQGYRDNRLLAKPRAAWRGTAADAEAKDGLRVHRTFPRMGHLRVLDLEPTDTADRAIRRLEATGRYEYVERDKIVRPLLTTPTDPSFTRQWSLNNSGQSGGTAGADIRAVSAWDTRTDASSIIVAVIDTGIRMTHQDLSGNLWTNAGGTHGINAVATVGSATYNDPSDTLGHGTHVAGIIGATPNNGIGISGVAWRTQLMALRFISSEDGGFLSDEIECIQYAIDNHAAVINASFGSSSYSQSAYDAIKSARDAGIIFVAAAGNGNENDGVASNNDVSPSYPSNYGLDNIVAVAAMTRTDALASYSNYGAGLVELAAPGSEIYSTWFDTDTSYMEEQGTSMAAPHVTGAIALLKAQFPTDTYRQTINRLLRATTKTAALNGKVQTGGRLNLAQALTSTSNRPFNDNFVDRSILSGSNFTIRTNNADATTETLSGETSHGGKLASHSLWWSWTAPDTTQVAFDTTGSAYDAVIAVYTGSSLLNLQAVGSTTTNAGRTIINVTGGTTYQIAVDSNNNVTGYTSVHISAVPVNDNYASAKVITGASASVSATLLGASRETGEPNPTGVAAGNSVWYKWTAPSSGHYFLSMFATDVDSVAAVYTGSSLAGLTRVASNDDSSFTNSDALVPFDATAGTMYYFQIDHSSRDNTTGGNFTMTLTEAAWQFPADDEITSSPAVGADGTIYFGAGSAKKNDTSVYALTATGSKKWSTATGEQGIIGGSPAIGSDGTVYIGSDNKLLYALNGSNGAIKWTFTADSSISSTPAIATDGTIYFRDNTTLRALTSGGSQKWNVALTGSTDGTYCSPVIDQDGTIYVGTNGGKLHAVSATGSIKWTFTADNDIYTSPTIATDGTVYFATLSGTVYALTPGATSATQKWRWTAAGNSSITSSIALGADGTLYFAAYDHNLYALSSSGSQKWSYALGDEVRAASPAVAADGTIYIPCYDGFVYAITANGALQRTYATAKPIRSSPAIAANRVFVGSADGKLYAFDVGQNAASSAWPMFHFNAARTGRASAPAPSITGQPQSRTVAIGTSVTLSVTATSGSTMNYQWYKNGTAIAGATASSFTIAAASSADAGSYTVAVSTTSGSTTSSAAIVSVLAAGTGASTLSNISARAYCSTGNNVTIGGFVISGSTSKRVLVRAVGPTLSSQGINSADVLADPMIEVYQGGSVFASNDNWSDNTNAAEITSLAQQIGASALSAGDTKSSALILSLTPGVYTFVVRGKNESSGIVLLEVYDADVGIGSSFVNISARADCLTGDRVTIGGFVISGSVSKKILVRAVGPTLTSQGLLSTEVLTDPVIELHRGAPTIGTNDNSGTNANALEIVSTGARIGAIPLATSDSKSAALLLDLQPGAYSFISSGNASTTGIVLIEVYDAD